MTKKYIFPNLNFYGDKGEGECGLPAVPFTVLLERYMLRYTAQVRLSDGTKIRP
jgi:hypothetical protein